MFSEHILFFSDKGDEIAGICLRFSHSVKWSMRSIELLKSTDTGFMGEKRHGCVRYLQGDLGS
jgi:hypothetical protein